LILKDIQCSDLDLLYSKHSEKKKHFGQTESQEQHFRDSDD